MRCPSLDPKSNQNSCNGENQEKPIGFRHWSFNYDPGLRSKVNFPFITVPIKTCNIMHAEFGQK